MPALRGIALLASMALATVGTPAADVERVRHEIEKRYEDMRRSYLENKGPDGVIAMRTADYTAHMPNGDVWDREKSAEYTRAAFQQVKKTLDVTFTIEGIEVHGNKAAVRIYQHWMRLQYKVGALRTVETFARQRETWKRTNEGWKLFMVDDIAPGEWRVDGKRVDPSKPYRPSAPEYKP